MCCSCNNAILKEIGGLQGVFAANVDFVNELVTVEHTDEVTSQQLMELLISIGLVSVEYI